MCGCVPDICFPNPESEEDSVDNEVGIEGEAWQGTAPWWERESWKRVGDGGIRDVC